jgi:hypothetical protein
VEIGKLRRIIGLVVDEGKKEVEEFGRERKGVT